MSAVLDCGGRLARLERRREPSRRGADAKLLATAAAAMAALDRLNQGVAIVEGSGRIRFANRMVHRLGGEGDGLRIRGGVLAGTAMPDAVHLSRALKVVAAGGADIALRLRRASGKRPLIVLIASVQLPTGVARSEPPSALSLITDPDLVAPPPKERLSEVYGLTATEGSLAQLLLQGLDVGAAASAMGIRVATARTHLRQVLAKTGTHRQAELVRVLLQEVGRLG